MALRHFLVASALVVAAGSAARADSITYGNFSNDSGLTLAGTAAQSGSEISLTNGSTYTAGAAYASNAFALGAGGSFTTSFQFQIATNGNGVNANGFAFVLSTAPQTNGLNNQNLGIGTNPNTSVAIEFSTYGNPNNNPVYTTTAQGKPIYNSNLVGVIADGNTCLSGSGTGGCNSGVNPNVGTVYGAGTGNSIANAGECDTRSSATSYTRAGCMANGDIWTVKITYQNGLLTVNLIDSALGGNGSNVISSLSYNIAGYLGTNNVYAGFTSSTGAGAETVNILNWTMNSNPVPEPLALGMFGIGLGALGLMRTRRRVA